MAPAVAVKAYRCRFGNVLGVASDRISSGTMAPSWIVVGQGSCNERRQNLRPEVGLFVATIGESHILCVSKSPATPQYVGLNRVSD